MIINLRADPYEKSTHEGEMGYLRWYADNMWLFVPVQSVIKEFLATIPGYPFQEGTSLNAAGINYRAAERGGPEAIAGARDDPLPNN